MPHSSQNLAFSAAFLAAALLASPLVAAEDDTIRIGTTADDHNIDCKGKALHISGQANNIALKRCPSVTVSGASNDIRITEPRRVNISGASNNLWISYTAAGILQITGSSNDIAVTAARSTEVTISDRGSENRISRSY